jgi:hypothetical protein
VRLDDAAAECKAQAETLPSDRIPVLSDIEHLKDTLFFFIRDPGTGVRHRDDDPITLPLGGQTDLRIGRGVFDGVACQIHQDLDNQTRIGPHKQDFL